MKIIIALLLSASFLIADNLPGTNVSSMLVPVSAADTEHAVTWQKYHKGGWHEAGDTNVRNAIPSAYRDTNMICYCKSDSTAYILVDGILNSNWKKLLGKTSSADWDSINFRAAHGKKVNLDGYNKGTSLAITQVPDTLQKGLNTGNSETLDSAWEAFRIITDSTMTVYTIAVQMKRTGTITNNLAQCFGYIYSESAGKPGTKLAAVNQYATQMFTTLTTSMVDKLYLVASSGATLPTSTVYWIVLNTSTAPVGGTVQINSSATGTGQYAESNNGTTWTLKDGVTGWYKLYGPTYPTVIGTGGVVNATTYTGPAVSALCFAGNNTSAMSAVHFGGGTAQYGLSPHGTGQRGSSTDGYGVEGDANGAGGIGGAFTGGKYAVGAEAILTGAKTFYAFENPSIAPYWDFFGKGAAAYNYFAGKVGIGDSTPAHKLVVVGKAVIDSVVANAWLASYGYSYFDLGTNFATDTKLNWNTVLSTYIRGSDSNMIFEHPGMYKFNIGGTPVFQISNPLPGSSPNYALLYNGNYYVDDTRAYVYGSPGSAYPTLTRGVAGLNGYWDVLAGGKNVLHVSRDTVVDSAATFLPLLAQGVLGLDVNKKIVNVIPASSDSARAAGKADTAYTLFSGTTDSTGHTQVNWWFPVDTIICTQAQPVASCDIVLSSYKTGFLSSSPTPSSMVPKVGNIHIACFRVDNYGAMHAWANIEANYLSRITYSDVGVRNIDTTGGSTKFVFYIRNSDSTSAIKYSIINKLGTHIPSVSPGVNPSVFSLSYSATYFMRFQPDTANWWIYAPNLKLGTLKTTGKSFFEDTSIFSKTIIDSQSIWIKDSLRTAVVRATDSVTSAILKTTQSKVFFNADSLYAVGNLPYWNGFPLGLQTGSAITGSGSPGKHTVWTSAYNIGNSSVLSESGTTLQDSGSANIRDTLRVSDGSNYGINWFQSKGIFVSPHHENNVGTIGYDYYTNDDDSNFCFGYSDVNTHDIHGLIINEITGKATINLPLYAHVVGKADTADTARTCHTSDYATSSGSASHADSATGSKYFAGQSYSTMFSGMQINRFTGSTHPDGGGEIYIDIPSDFTPRIVSFSVLVKGDNYTVPPGETMSGYLYTCHLNSNDNRFEIANDYSNSAHIRSKAITISTFAVTP